MSGTEKEQYPKDGLSHLVKETGLVRLGAIIRKYRFSRSGIAIIPILIILFFLSTIVGRIIPQWSFPSLILYATLGFAAGVYFFIYGILHFLDIGMEDKRHLYAILLPFFIFLFTVSMINPWSNRLIGTHENIITGIMFIYLIIVMFPIILVMFLNSGFFCSVILHGVIMKRSKRLARSKGFSISVLIFLMTMLTLLLLGSLLASGDPTANFALLGLRIPWVVVIPLMLLVPFMIVFMGFSTTVGILNRVRKMPEKAEAALFLGVVIYSVYAYLWAFLILLSSVGQAGATGSDLPVVASILSIVFSVYYISSILGVLGISSMRILKIGLEE